MSLPDKDANRPLYAQVRERLVDRIRSGEWKPGQLIANEFEIAAEFGVSQGTARKAISDLASNRLVVGWQVPGTSFAGETAVDEPLAHLGLERTIGIFVGEAHRCASW